MAGIQKWEVILCGIKGIYLGVMRKAPTLNGGQGKTTNIITQVTQVVKP